MKNKSKRYIAILSILFIAALAANYRNIKTMVDVQTMPYQYAATFSKIYEINHWGKGSGEGSNPVNAAEYLSVLQTYFDDPRFETIVDLGCGDWQIMSKLSIPQTKKYIGLDVVPSIIKHHQTHYSAANVRFMGIESLREFKERGISGDLLIVKDVMQHWPNSEIAYFIENILPNFKYALLTNELLEKDNYKNADIRMGAFRSLDLRAAPYSLENVSTVLEYAGPGWKQVILYTNPKFNS